MKESLRRLSYLLNRNRRGRELDDEMAFHREMAERAGRPEARRTFGSPVRLREEAREAWGWTWIDRLGQDLRYAGRTLSRTPAFTLTAVLVLAVGIGVNVAAFSMFNLFALKLLPVRDPESLVRLQRYNPGGSTNVMPYPSMVFYRDHARTLSAVMGTMYATVTLESDEKLVRTEFATSNYFSELGTQPFLGRVFDPTRDDAADAPPVAMLSYALWERRFGSDTSIVGRIIHINGKTATVIGVAPRTLAALGGAHPDLWLPLLQAPYFVQGSTALTDMRTNGGSVQMWGRLAAGVSAKSAKDELLSLTNQLRDQYPKVIWDKEFIQIDPGGHNDVVGTEMYAAVGIVGTLVLLILVVACANLGGLLLARGVSREHEIGIRLAIGANRGRIFRQLLTESVLLAALGSAMGVFLSYVVLRVAMSQLNLRPWMSAAPDWRVFLFALAIGLFASVVFGFVPALQIARQRHRGTLARRVLLSAQVAASCVLIILAGLLVHAVEHVMYTSPGFGYEQVLAVDLNLSLHGYNAAQARGYLDQFESRIQAIPGVQAVALSSMPPLGHDRISMIGDNVNGQPLRVYPFRVDKGFLPAMGIPIIRGRSFLTSETHGIVVSESFAKRQWPGRDPLGLENGIGFEPGDVVVGVARDAHLIQIQDNDAVELYRLAQPADMADLTVIVKTMGAPEGLTFSVRTIAQQMDSRLVPDIRTLKSEFNDATHSATYLAIIVTLLGAVAVLLAAIGILGLVAYTASQRTKEIAIRIALGASRTQLLRSVLGQFGVPVLIGLVLGLGAMAALSQVLRRVLYGVSHLDPVSYGVALTILASICAIAALLPARRAISVDVAKALHQE